MESLVNKKLLKKLTKKKILIFGNSGFIGSWLSLTFYLFKIKTLGVSLKMKDNKYLSNSKFFKDNIKTIYNDIKNINSIKSKIKNFKPDIVIHLASQPIVSESFVNPYKTFDDNIIGTVKILDFVKECKSIKKIIIFTSDKVYENKYKTLNEKSSLGGLDPYSASKSCQDIVCQSYNYNFLKTQMIIIRSGNIIGGGDWGEKRLFPDIINSFKKKKKLDIRNVNSTRPWLHILDVINAVLKIICINFKKKTNIFNLAPSKKNQIDVKNILDIVKKYTEITQLKINLKKNKFKEKIYLKLSSKKINQQIGWKSRIGIKKGIILTISLYLTQEKQKVHQTIKQISNFFN